MSGVGGEGVMEALAAAGMSDDMLGEMRELAGKAGTAENFADLIFIGNCPKCGSEEVANCEETRTIEDVTVARCFQCGLFWCTECGNELSEDAAECPHWKICEACVQQDDCPYIVDSNECPKIAKWIEAAAQDRKGREPGWVPGEARDSDEADD
jgi:hypothetical protein